MYCIMDLTSKGARPFARIHGMRARKIDGIKRRKGNGKKAV